MKIRLCGIVLLIVSLVGFHWLAHGFAVVAVQRSTWLEIAVAAICVPAWLFGLPMMAMGSGLFTRTDLPPPGGKSLRDPRHPTKKRDHAARHPPIS